MRYEIDLAGVQRETAVGADQPRIIYKFRIASGLSTAYCDVLLSDGGVEVMPRPVCWLDSHQDSIRSRRAFREVWKLREFADPDRLKSRSLFLPGSGGQFSIYNPRLDSVGIPTGSRSKGRGSVVRARPSTMQTLVAWREVTIKESGLTIERWPLMSRKLDTTKGILWQYITIVHISTILALSVGELLQVVLHLRSKLRQG